MSLTSRSRSQTAGSTNLAGSRSYGKTFNSSQYSIPARSLEHPLRSVLLDPTVNNIPLSKTRSDLVRKIKKLSLPNNSYDLDGDGEVSHEDLRYAKRFDVLGKGELSEEEFHNAKAQIVNEFVMEHDGEMNDLFRTPLAFGDSMNKSMTSMRSSSNLGNSLSFVDNTASFEAVDAAYEKMRKVQKQLKSSGSWPMKNCLRSEDTTLLKHNFYTNKFDQTAWNDFDAIPRSASIYGLSDHGGSRKRLMFSRRQTDREHADALMEDARQKLPIVDTRRLKLISDMSVENS